MRRTTLVLAILLAIPATASAKRSPIKDAKAAIEDALDAAGEDRDCKRAVSGGLEDALDQLDSGGQKNLKKAKKLLSRTAGDADDCDKDVVRAIGDAEAALEDALEDSDDDEGGDDDDGDKKAKKQRPAADDPEVQQAACQAGKGGACYALAERHAAGNGVDKDETAAVEYYERACGLRHMASCNAMGNIYFEGWGGTEQDHKRAYGMYKKACDGGHGDGCYSLGYLTEKGEGTTTNVKQSFALYQKSCKRSSGLGCFAVGNAYKNGFAGVTTNERTAADYFDKACNFNNGEACFRLAEMYRDGSGVKKSEGKEHVYYASACNAGFQEGCQKANVGKVMKEGMNQLTKGVESLQGLSF